MWTMVYCLFSCTIYNYQLVKKCWPQFFDDFRKKDLVFAQCKRLDSFVHSSNFPVDDQNSWIIISPRRPIYFVTDFVTIHFCGILNSISRNWYHLENCIRMSSFIIQMSKSSGTMCAFGDKDKLFNNVLLSKEFFRLHVHCCTVINGENI